MIKIAALNKESEEESGSEEEVTKEALEQIALQQYSKALELQRKGYFTDAIQLLKDLLDTELLDGVKKPSPGENISGPLFNLKYLCYKNLASILNATGEIEAAIEAYGAAAELDDTDVTLWHRLGLICMHASRYEIALHAFQRGVDRNPKHWPCLDKIVTLLLGLDNKEECISTIYDTLQLDPGYMRGLVYRKYIYTKYKHIRDFMEYLNPMYKWNEKDDEALDEEMAEKLLKEAEKIQHEFIKQQEAEQFRHVLPNLKLIKPITRLTWEAVGDSLTHMHTYISENCFSHACRIEIVVKIETTTEETKPQPIEVSEEIKKPEVESKSEDTSVMEVEKTTENVSENENNDMMDKTATDTEKIESDVEVVANESVTEITPTQEPKKKNPIRRRGSALSFLQQWEWCNKRRSSRKKPVSRQDRLDDNIYDMLRRLVPLFLNPDSIKKDEGLKQEENDVSDVETTTIPPIDIHENKEYFETEDEQNDVKNFIEKYTESKCDIIDLLKTYIYILAGKWKMKWPQNLPDVFIVANNCYNNHIDPPAYAHDNNTQEILNYVAANLLVEEFMINKKLNSSIEEKQRCDLSVLEYIGSVICLKPHIFTETEKSFNVNQMELVLRHLWVKLHVYILNRCEELALECLYQLSYEFEAMGDYQFTYSLSLVNFTFKPIITYHEITKYINFLERNKKLSNVLNLYERGDYEEVLCIVIDAFEHCKDIARNQEEEMSLDFAVQLSVILDTYWALDDLNNCMSWSFTCLHEALKHYFRYTSGSSDYEKWTLTVVKILSCIEHLIATKGLSVLEILSRKQLSQGLENLIRIIGHQVETKATEMPFGTVIPWIIMHFILQREEDLGRGRTTHDNDAVNLDDVPNPLMVLFIAHEHLGNRSWCCVNDGKLLYFILDIVVPRLRSPALSKPLEQVCQYMEQCVYCLYGHPGKKHKLKYLSDHNVSPHSLDWQRAQQLYEIFRPPMLPPLEGKLSGITADTEQLFHRILALLPPENDPQKYIAEVEKYIRGTEDKLPYLSQLLPYKMRDIYFLLGDYYFKKDEVKMAIKYNILDVIVNNDRFESWAEISLAKVVNLERIINSCKNLNNEKEVLTPAKAVIRCFKRALELDPNHCNMWIEYGMFVYFIHSFCSRMQKQTSKSLSMEEFESLENQKESMLDITQKCFKTVLNDLNCSHDDDKSESWLYFYMLGKVAEKRNRPPSEYLNYYLQGVRSLQEIDATYPLKINYNSPTHLCIEVLELHYRIHASILKYIEQHENKPVPASVGKTFATCIEEWNKGQFSKKAKRDGITDTEPESKDSRVCPANILKRSISDAGEGDTQETKKMKTEAAAAKIRRSASYETERVNKDQISPKPNQTAELAQVDKEEANKDIKPGTVGTQSETKTVIEDKTMGEKEEVTNNSTEKSKLPGEEKKGETSSSSSSSSSSSGSSSSDSSTDSSSDNSRDSDASDISTAEKSLTDDEIMKIVSACLDALEDCASRFPPHYKAIYRLTHYHFYYKKGKDIERCRDLMLSTFTSRAGQKLGGLFSERKHSNFFNNIWKIPLDDVDRAGSFSFHMNRSVLLTMEILKEIDDHKTLLDLSLHLQRIPEPDKKYLRDSDREDLAQQAFSLCVQSLKGQLLKFSQQADLKSNDVERQALKSLMLDIYRAYQRAQKQSNSKQFTNLLIDAYKLVVTVPISDNMNLVDLSMKYCQSLIQTLKQQATQASIDKSQNAQKKQTTKVPTEAVKATTSAVSQPKIDTKTSISSTSTTTTSGLPKMSAHDMAAAFQNFLPVLNDPVLSHQTAAALSYLSNISALASYPTLPLQSTLQKSLQNSFQAEFYRQFISQTLAPYGLPPQKPKQKRGPKPGVSRSLSIATSQSKPSKSFNKISTTTISKSVSMSNVSGQQKSTSASLAPSMGKVLPTLPASMTANLSAFGASTSIAHSSNHSMPSQAHMANSTTVNAAIHSKPPMLHIASSSGKTLQEKLAERQKNLPPISLSKLPSSLTITKTSVPKPSFIQSKKPETKKPIGESGSRRKPISSDEVIVVDDD